MNANKQSSYVHVIFHTMLTIVMVICTSYQAVAGEAPYPSSAVITGISFDMETLRVLAPGSDNWVVTWADDDHQYASWGDGGGFNGTNSDGRVSMGIGRIEGGRNNYQGFNVWGGKNAENPAQFKGKSYGIVSIDGVLYMWRTGDGSDGSAFNVQNLYQSTDHSSTWVATGVSYRKSDFSGSNGFFAPTFLQFGKDFQGARDDFVYIYAPENKGNNWNVQTPGEIALIRMPKDSITVRSSYEYFEGQNANGDPLWSSDVNDRIPVFLDAINGVMRTSVSYNAGLKRYMLITQQVDRFKSGNGHIGIYDAPEPWGPWTTVLFENAWAIGLQKGSKTVYWNFSNKWLGAEGGKFVLVYTGDGADVWGTVEGSLSVGEEDIPLPPTSVIVE